MHQTIDKSIQTTPSRSNRPLRTARWLACLPAMVVFMQLCGTLAQTLSAEKPNVIVVVTDDQGYGDMSCHGNPWLKTPAMDQLSSDSVRLTDYHVDPTCSPTRAALMTGRYSSRVGVWLTYGSRHHLRKDETCMAQVFKDNGYRTAIFGKWHLGDNYPFRPGDRGFDESLIHGGGVVGETPDYWGNNYYDDVYFRNGNPERVKGYCTDVWFDEAIKFVDRNREQPFFLYLPTNAPHGPLHVPASYARPYQGNPEIPASRAFFFGMLASIDENLGRLRRHLSETGLERDTIVVFMNDNGTAQGVTLKRNGKADRSGWEAGGFNAGMRGRKGSAYEGGHRAACFISWPAAGLAGGRDVDALTAHIDLLPTLIDLCGLRLKSPAEFDGASIATLLKGEDDQWPARTLFVHHQGRFGNEIGEALPIREKDYCVMTGRWRMVGSELYDRKNDPGQREDVATDHPQVIERLKAKYDSWWDDISVRFDEHCPFIIDPARQRTVMVSSQNYLGGRVNYSQHHVRNAIMSDGWTTIDVAEPGEYQVTLRRWPRESGEPLDAVVDVHPMSPATHNVEGKMLQLPSRAIKVASVRLRVGGFEDTQTVKPGQQEVTFDVTLDMGEQKLQGWLTDQSGATTAAYFIYIEPK